MENQNKPKWLKVGAIFESKNKPDTYYIKINDAINLEAGTILQVIDPRSRAGITAEQLAKIKDFVKFEVLLPPPAEKQS